MVAPQPSSDYHVPKLPGAMLNDTWKNGVRWLGGSDGGSAAHPRLGGCRLCLIACNTRQIDEVGLR